MVPGTTRVSEESKLILQSWSIVLEAAWTFTVPSCIKTNLLGGVHTECGIPLSTCNAVSAC